MKIAHLVFSPQLLQYTEGLLDQLITRGHTVGVFTTHKLPSNAPEEQKALVNKYNVTYECWSWFDLKGIQAFAPDLILMWNGYAPWTYAAMKWFKDRYHMLYIERGWLPQKDYCYIADDLASHSSFIMDRPEGPIPLVNVDKLRALYKPRYTDSALPERFIFVPAQLDEDTSITISSPIFKNCDSFLGALRHYIPNTPVIVKNHPLFQDKSRSDKITLYSGPLSSMDLAAQSTVVAGLTSTVLTEALIYEKPVASFGQNVGSPSHIHYPYNPETSFKTIKSILRGDLTWKPRVPYLETISWLLSKQWNRYDVPQWVSEYIESYVASK